MKAGGATSCIAKPIDIDQLLAVINRLGDASIAKATV